MGIAFVETRLASVIAHPQIFKRQATRTNSEFTLRRAARKYDLCELFKLLADHHVDGLSHFGCTVVSSTGRGDQDVLLRPFAFINHISQLPDVDLEMCRAVAEICAVSGDRCRRVFQA